MKHDAYLEHLRATFGDILMEENARAENEFSLRLQSEAHSHLPRLCLHITTTLHARLITIVASDERIAQDRFSLRYIFSLADEDVFLILHVPVASQHREVPSIGAVIEGADWCEREIKDWFGIIAFPNIRTLAVHPDWPEDVYPMLHDFNARESVPRVKGSFDFPSVEGEGVFEIPVGPVHAGIIEPGHFRFSAAGEPIVNLDAQLYYTHKGTEKIAEGLPAGNGVFFAERISGDTSFAHALAYCHAVERACGITVPRSAIIFRTIALEFERIYNHVGDIGAIMLDVGFAYGAATAFRLKERCMQLNEALSGSRLLRGVAAIGGVKHNRGLSPDGLGAVWEGVAAVRREFDTLITLALSSSTVIDRLETTGVLSHADAVRLGIVGIAARASGVPGDLRKDHPHCGYADLRFSTALSMEGDVLARMKVRIDEVRESFFLLEQLRQMQREDPSHPTIKNAIGDGAALGYVEGWRGEIFHWIRLDERGNILRWKITDPSFHNWRALKVAVLNNIIADFPVINKSFNLSYSGNDR